LWIESCHTIVGAHPQIAMAIFQNAAHDVAWEAFPLRVSSEAASYYVESIEPFLSTYPHGARAIKVDRVHAVVA
jgi:hypothetical protein